MLLSWCGWHIQVLCNFYEKVDMKMIRSIWSPWQNETGATATNPKMMPRQHIGSGRSWRYRCKRKRGVSVSCKMVGWSRQPGSHGSMLWQREHARNTSGTLQTRAFHATYAFVHGQSFSAVYLRSIRFGVDGFKVEVVVDGSSWEVVAHVAA